MNFILENITVEYLKNKSTGEEIFLREKGCTLLEPEWISQALDSGDFEIIEKQEETFHDPIIKYALPRYDYKTPRNYGTLQNQLDMLWHDIDNGLFGDSAKTGEWYQYIKNIKDQHPKP